MSNIVSDEASAEQIQMKISCETSLEPPAALARVYSSANICTTRFCVCGVVFFFSFPWNEFIGFPRVSTLIKQRCCGNQHLRDLRRVESAAAARGCAEDGEKSCSR